MKLFFKCPLRSILRFPIKYLYHIVALIYARILLTRQTVFINILFIIPIFLFYFCFFIFECMQVHTFKWVVMITHNTGKEYNYNWISFMCLRF